MARFVVAHRYASRRDGQQFAWTGGEVVELDDADAEWVNRDSPGVLSPIEFEAKEPEPVPVVDASVAETPAPPAAAVAPDPVTKPEPVEATKATKAAAKAADI